MYHSRNFPDCVATILFQILCNFLTKNTSEWFNSNSCFFFQAPPVPSTILPPKITNSITQPLDQLNLHPSIPSSIPSGQPLLPPIGVPSSQHITQLPATSNSMVNIGQQDHQMQNVYQQAFNNHNPISTSVSVQNLSLPQNQSLTNFQHSVSLDETLQSFNLKKLPENLKQILERLVRKKYYIMLT